MEFREITSYRDLVQFSLEKDHNHDYCLDATEIEPQFVKRFDSKQDGYVGGCLESHELMAAVNTNRFRQVVLFSQPLFDTQAMDLEKKAAQQWKQLLEKVSQKEELKRFLNLFLDRGMTFPQVIQFLSEAGDSYFYADRLWQDLENKGAKREWLLEVYLHIPKEERGNPFFFSDFRRLWDNLIQEKLSAAVTMDIISRLIAERAGYIREVDGDVVKQTMRKFNFSAFWQLHRDYVVPEERAKNLIRLRPLLLAHKNAESFIDNLIKPLMATGWSDTQITKLFDAYINRDDSDYRYLAQASVSLNAFGLGSEDSLDVLVFIVKLPERNSSSALQSIGTYHVGGFKKLKDSRLIKDILFFCFQFNQWDPRGPVRLADELARKGWSANKIKGFINTLPKDEQFPTYEGYGRVVLALEAMGVSYKKIVDFVSAANRSGRKSAFFSDEAEVPEILAIIRRQGGFTDFQALQHLAGIYNKLLPPPYHTGSPFRWLHALLKMGIPFSLLVDFTKDLQNFSAWEQTHLAWSGLRTLKIKDQEITALLKEVLRMHPEKPWLTLRCIYVLAVAFITDPDNPVQQIRGRMRDPNILPMMGELLDAYAERSGQENFERRFGDWLKNLQQAQTPPFSFEEFFEVTQRAKGALFDYLILAGELGVNLRRSKTPQELGKEWGEKITAYCDRFLKAPKDFENKAQRNAQRIA